MFIGSQSDLTFGASDKTKSSAFCVCCVFLAIFGRTLWVRVGLKEQPDLAPQLLQIYANNVLLYATEVRAAVFSRCIFPDTLGFRNVCI